MTFNIADPSDLARLTLVASDMSYGGNAIPIGEPLRTYGEDGPSVPNPYDSELAVSGFEVIRPFQDNGSGFKAVVFRNFTTNDVIVAFAGVDGLDFKDWWGSNTHYGWNQWDRNRRQLFDFLESLTDGAGQSLFTGRIHFTGQSLGGALAQYAAYEFIANNSTFGNERLTLTTFNGLGGLAALQEELPGSFNHDLVAGMAWIRHYFMPNDIVVRLGLGHLGASTYELPFRPGGTIAGANRLLEFGIVEGHRVESGFYANLQSEYQPPFAGLPGWFNVGLQRQVEYLLIPNLQKAASFFGNPLKNRTVTSAEATIRIAGGLLFAPILTPPQEVNRLVWALADHARVSNSIGDSQYEFLRGIDWGVTSKFLAVGATVASPLILVKTFLGSVVLGWLASGLGLSGGDAARNMQDEFGATENSITPPTLPLHENQTQYEILRARFEVAEGSLLASVDLEGLAEQMVSGEGWQRRTLTYVQNTSGLSLPELAQLDVNFAALVNNAAITSNEQSGEYAQRIFEVIREHLNEAGQRIANGNSQFTGKYANVDPGLFGTVTDFVAYDAIHDALEEAARHPDSALIEDLIDEELDIVESAGLTVDLEAEHPVSNPFDTVGFDPDLAPLPSEQVREGSIKRFTLSLPYGAGEGGQRIAVTLEGTAAPNVRLLAGGEEVLPQGGVYAVTVPRGERELELSLWGALGITEPGLTEPGALTVSATLVDGAGQATHLMHLEANVEFVARDDLVFEGTPGLTADNDQTTLHSYAGVAGELGVYIQYGNGNDVVWGDVGRDRFLGGAGDDRLFGSFRLYFGANDRDWLSGGPGDDQLLGHEGDDILEGDSGRDVVLGDVGDDLLFGGNQADYETIFTLGGLYLEGDVVQGGAGNDLVVGSGGADALSGGNGADLIFGGAGNDELRGDTEFVPTHFFQIIGSTFPPEQPLAGAADVLYGNAGLDTLLGEAGADRLYGGEGGDTLIGGEGQDELYGGAGEDLLVGDADSLDPLVHTDDFLHGGEGNDYLRGQGGSDTLVGDAGEDRLEGGDGADIYVFNRGDGIDTILDDGPNTVRFGPGIDAQDLKLGLGSLYISVGSNGDAIRIENFNPDDLLGLYAIDNFQFLDGTQLTYAQLVARGFDLAGSEFDDEITGANVTDRIVGGEGNDILNGKAGADVMSGGPGEDIFIVDEASDVINEAPDEGIDTVQSAAASYTLGPNLENLALICEQLPGNGGGDEEGASFAVATACGFSGTGNELDNQLFGNEHDNVLDGGAGNDFLAGDLGSDTYLFGRGSGADTIFEFDDTPGNADVVQFASDIAPGDIRVMREADSLVLAIRGSEDRVTLSNWFASDAEKVEQAIFTNGTVWDAAALEALANAAPANSAPQLANPIPDQPATEDALFELSFAAVFADPGDTLGYAASFPDWLTFDAVSRQFSGTPANEDVGTYEVSVTATDPDGLSASDTFTLTVANVNDAPTLAGPISDKTALEDAVFGFTLPQHTFADVDAGDALSFSAAPPGGGALPTWLVFDGVTQTFTGTPTNDDVGTLGIEITATDRAGASATGAFTLTVENVIDAPLLASPLLDQYGNQNAPFRFAVPDATFRDVDAGDVLTFSAALADPSTSSGQAALPAWLGFDPLSRTFSGTPSEFDVGTYEVRVSATDSAGAAAAGTFALSISDAAATFATHVGTRRADVIRTGFDNDLIEAGKGDDVVSSGAGRDLILAGKGDDHVHAGHGNDYLFGGKGRDWLLGEAGNDVLFGQHGDDHLDGGAGNDVLDGGAGRDHLFAGAGNNLLVGGPGGDTLVGGAGHDVFLFNRGDGKANLHLGDAAASGNTDTLSLGEGITPNDIILRRKGDDLIVKVDESDEEPDQDGLKIVLKDWYDRAADHRTVTRLQLIRERIETYDFKALVARYEAASGGRERHWHAGAAMNDALLSVSASEAIGGALAHQYATQGTLAHVSAPTIQATLADPLFGGAPQPIVDAGGQLLEPYFAAEGEAGTGAGNFVALVSDPGAVNGALLFPPATSEEVADPPRPGRRGGHKGKGSDDEERWEALIESWFDRARDGAMPLSALLDGDDAIDGAKRRGRHGQHHPTQDEIAASWRRTQALLEAHLSTHDPAALGGGEERPFSTLLSGLGSPHPVLSGDRLSRISGHPLRRLEGLEEGLSRLGS